MGLVGERGAPMGGAVGEGEVLAPHVGSPLGPLSLEKWKWSW